MIIAKTMNTTVQCNQNVNHTAGPMPNGNPKTNEAGETRITAVNVRTSQKRDIRINLRIAF